MFENVGGAEILLVLLVILIFFGPKKIPELAQSLGKGLRKFNETKDGFQTQVSAVMKEPLESIQEAKLGFEAKIKEASAPLREAIMPGGEPATKAAPRALPSATLPRGIGFEDTESEEIPT